MRVVDSIVVSYFCTAPRRVLIRYERESHCTTVLSCARALVLIKLKEDEGEKLCARTVFRSYNVGGKGVLGSVFKKYPSNSQPEEGPVQLSNFTSDKYSATYTCSLRNGSV